MIIVTQNKFEDAVSYLSSLILERERLVGHHYNLAGIAQGGIPVVMALAEMTGRDYSVVGGPGFVNDPENTIIVDDLADSGETIMPWIDRGFICAVLGHKPSFEKVQTGPGIFLSAISFEQEWVQFWWEPGDDKADPERNITRVLQFLGEDVNRNGLKETPARVVRSWEHLYGGYKKDPKDVFKKFDEPVQDDLVIMKNISFSSTCEHHMLPFIGKAHIAYIPKGNKVIGASKMIRLLEIFAHRLQIQERIAQQVCDALETHLECSGCACIIEAVHSCILCRGVGNSTAELVTPVLRGDLRAKENTALRAELYANIARP